MSQNTEKSNMPPVKVELTESEFRELNEALEYTLHYGTTEEQEQARKLQNKIMKYSRDVTDEDGFNRKRICFFEKEAASVINILIKGKEGGGNY